MTDLSHVKSRAGHALETVLTIALFVRQRWTYPFALANAILGAAFAIPALYLLQNDLLFNPALVEKIAAATGGGAWIDTSALITGVVVAVVIAWDTIDGFRKARRAASAAPASVTSGESV